MSPHRTSPTPPEPALPTEGEGPVFTQPWEARVFGLVLHLYQQGRFTWPEWTEYLSAEIAARREAGERDDGSDYYTLWSQAAAKLFAAKGLLAEDELAAMEAEIAANPVPPHGKAQREPVAVDRGTRT